MSAVQIGLRRRGAVPPVVAQLVSGRMPSSSNGIIDSRLNDRALRGAAVGFIFNSHTFGEKENGDGDRKPEQILAKAG